MSMSEMLDKVVGVAESLGALRVQMERDGSFDDDDYEGLVELLDAVKYNFLLKYDKNTKRVPVDPF